jgi:uncharacterized protein (DUF1684 family)
MFVPGLIEFSVEGRSHSLRPLVGDADDTSGLIIFKDLTSESETYAAGRYLSVELDGDRVELDFNRAYNPPCAFTPYATCPLPPRENHLELAVRAGERRYESAKYP